MGFDALWGLSPIMWSVAYELRGRLSSCEQKLQVKNFSFVKELIHYEIHVNAWIQNPFAILQIVTIFKTVKL